MEYKLRDGVILECICGEFLLIATLKARSFCPYIFQLNEASAFICQGLLDGAAPSAIAAKAASEYGIGEQEALESVNTFIEQLKENGYLIDTEKEKTGQGEMH